MNNSFLQQLDPARIERAIAEAERKTSGELRVFFHRGSVADPVATAAAEFARLGMQRTRLRNAILIFVAPDAHAFAIYGDTGVHEKCGQTFWNAVAGDMETHFKRGAFTDGIVGAIERAGELLATHFPWRPDDINELHDDVIDRGIVI